MPRRLARARARRPLAPPGPAAELRRQLLSAPRAAAELTKSPPEGISVGPKDDNLFIWEILLVGPAGTAL